MTFSKPHRPALAALLALSAVLATALACQVPVFRYALERWEPDAYEVVVTGAEALTPAQRAAVDFLRDAPLDAEAPANISLRIAANDAAVSGKPRFELYYPRRLREFLSAPFWTGELTMENARAILHSPARTRLARNILEGHSATWIFVETGNREKDDTAAAALAGFANEAKGSLRIPDGVIGANETAGLETLSPSEAENVLTSDVPLKIDFSVLRLSRNDPAEKVFLAMLLNVEDDLGDFTDEPMTFAAFGRGRILQPLIGRGITAENVMFDSSYLCGACSCQVKEENPGIDILLAAPWDAALEGSAVIVDKVLPPLAGTAALVKNPAAAGAPETPPLATADPGPSAPAQDPSEKIAPFFATPVLIAVTMLALILAGMIIVTLQLRRTGK